VRKIYKHGTVLGVLAGAMLLVSAQGAMAATEPTTSPEGFGIQGSGLVTVPAQPIATAANPTPACTATVAAGIVTANTVCAAVNGNQTTAAVAGLTALLTSGISAGAISSSCTANSDGTFTMASNLVNLVIPGAVIPVNPAPNTSLLGGAVILNQQINGPDGGTERTVNALVVNLLGQSLTVASSTCGPFVQGAPIAGGKGLALGLGALGAGVVGVTAVKLNRRRRLTDA
jgi:hypothetical protein